MAINQGTFGVVSTVANWLELSVNLARHTVSYPNRVGQITSLHFMIGKKLGLACWRALPSGPVLRQTTYDKMSINSLHPTPKVFGAGEFDHYGY